MTAVCRMSCQEQVLQVTIPIKMIHWIEKDAGSKQKVCPWPCMPFLFLVASLAWNILNTLVPRPLPISRHASSDMSLWNSTVCKWNAALELFRAANMHFVLMVLSLYATCPWGSVLENFPNDLEICREKSKYLFPKQRVLRSIFFSSSISGIREVDAN